MTTNYNPMELMICVASRELEDGSTLAVGTGAPCAAAMLAQKLNSPNLAIMFEAEALVRNCLRCPFPSVIREPVTRL